MQVETENKFKQIYSTSANKEFKDDFYSDCYLNIPEDIKFKFINSSYDNKNLNKSVIIIDGNSTIQNRIFNNYKVKEKTLEAN